MAGGKPNKSRWSIDENSMLVEAWTEAHEASGGSHSRRGRSLDQAIFSRYEARCDQAHSIRRSCNALSSQRDRMCRFARFVRNFDRQQAALGRRSWFQLSSEEQSSANIPRDCRRQLATFTDRTFKAVLHLLPGKDNQRSDGTQRARESPVRPRQACWTPVEEIRLTRRWGRLVKRAGLTMQAFVEQPLEQKYQRFTPSGRSPVAASRKIRSLVNSYMFIRFFNEKHSPGWFALSEAERDAQSEDGELPMDFEEITRDVFNALEEVDHVLSGRVATPAGQPTKEAPLLPMKSETMVPLPPKEITLPPLKDVATLPPPASITAPPPPKKEGSLLGMKSWGVKDGEIASVLWGNSPPNALDQLMLEEDSADEMPQQVTVGEEPAALTSLSDGALVSDANALVNDQMLENIELLAVAPPDGVASQLQCKIESAALGAGVGDALECALGQYDCKLKSGLQQLQVTIERESLRNWACFRSVQATIRAVNGDVPREFARALEEQSHRIVAALQRVQENTAQEGAGLRELICQRVDEDHVKMEPRRDGAAMLPHTSTLGDLGGFLGCAS